MRIKCLHSEGGEISGLREPITASSASPGNDGAGNATACHVVFTPARREVPQSLDQVFFLSVGARWRESLEDRRRSPPKPSRRRRRRHRPPPRPVDSTGLPSIRSRPLRLATPSWPLPDHSPPQGAADQAPPLPNLHGAGPAGPAPAGAALRGRTFPLVDPDPHTLANAVRAILNGDPSVAAAAYSVPHPSEPLVNVRVETSAAAPRGPTAALRAALGDEGLRGAATAVRDAFLRAEEAHEAAREGERAAAAGAPGPSGGGGVR